MNNDEIGRRVSALMAEIDPVKRAALSRKLRADLWGLLDEEKRGMLVKLGFDASRQHAPLRVVK